jgi:putative heme-binding domain-containing protein
VRHKRGGIGSVFRQACCKFRPDLSEGAATTERPAGRDLLEAVVYPSASIVQGYQPFNVQTRDGQSYSGILVRQAHDAVWLRGADQAEVKVDAQRIVSMTESTVSLMPQGLDAILGRDEFRDLLAYLQSLKRLTSAAAERPRP